MPVLIDGREVASTSPEWRMECLARHVLTLKPLAARQSWLEGYDQKAGEVAGQELRLLMLTVHEAKKCQVPTKRGSRK